MLITTWLPLTTGCPVEGLAVRVIELLDEVLAVFQVV
jgi:hypothetical protein